jgi:DNA-binding MarR family transcriptional regulator
MKPAQKKLSKLQKSILEKIAKSKKGFVRVSSLYDPAAPNLNAARAATSRALARLQARGLIVREASKELALLERRKVRAYRLTNAEN